MPPLRCDRASVVLNRVIECGEEDEPLERPFKTIIGFLCSYHRSLCLQDIYLEKGALVTWNRQANFDLRLGSVYKSCSRTVPTLPGFARSLKTLIVSTLAPLGRLCSDKVYYSERHEDIKIALQVHKDCQDLTPTKSLNYKVWLRQLCCTMPRAYAAFGGKVGLDEPLRLLEEAKRPNTHNIIVQAESTSELGLCLQPDIQGDPGSETHRCDCENIFTHCQISGALYHCNLDLRSLCDSKYQRLRETRINLLQI